MSADQKPVGNTTTESGADGAATASVRRPVVAAAGPLNEDTRVAVEIRGLVERGAMDEARERFAELVTRHQRRAARIAYQYLRDPSEADEAVQDAFVKVFSHIGSYREACPFEVWFTKIPVNGCLDRRKARLRRDRWFVGGEISSADEARVSAAGTPGNPEQKLLARERRERLAAAVDRLDGRQRTVFMLSQCDDRTPKGNQHDHRPPNRPCESTLPRRPQAARCWEATVNVTRSICQSGSSTAIWPTATARRSTRRRPGI
jgi:RNA polymerase sigma-70 factor (ECF subfamily)